MLESSTKCEAPPVDGILLITAKSNCLSPASFSWTILEVNKEA